MTGRTLPRRTVLGGLGATIALPLLDAMVPARASGVTRLPRPKRLVCIEMVHGAAGSSRIGAAQHLWAPASHGRGFDLSTTSLRALEPFRDRLTIVSNTDVRNADPFTAREIGGDHFRSSAVFLTQARPKRTEGADVAAGPSLDQLYARRAGSDTPLASMQVCIENVDEAGGCQYGYSCTYVDTISWASPTKPLPMVRDPRAVFDEMFGVVRRDANEGSILDWILGQASRMRARLGPADRVRLDDYLESVREIERRIQNVERWNRSGQPREFPGAPAGVPDSFDEHVALMFDLQVAAFRSDITRVFAVKLGRDGSNRVYPESGVRSAFHPLSHHGNREDRILELARLNAYHVQAVARLLAQLQAVPDGDGSLLDGTLVLYGSPMGDPNLHNHRNVPFFLVGHADGAIAAGQHLAPPAGTPLANVMLSVLHALGCEDITQFGDSTAALSLT